MDGVVVVPIAALVAANEDISLRVCRDLVDVTYRRIENVVSRLSGIIGLPEHCLPQDRAIRRVANQRSGRSGRSTVQVQFGKIDLAGDHKTAVGHFCHRHRIIVA